MLNPVETPEQADIIIDDLIDSGSTEKQYAKYKKPFIGLFNKKTESELGNKWLKFPWEQKNEPLKDNIVRICQYYGLEEVDNIEELIKQYENR